MGIILNEYHNFIEYSLYHVSTGELIIVDPIGWEDDNKEIIRDSKAHGKRVKINSNLEFPDVNDENKTNPYNFIIDIYNLYGINAEVILKRYVKDSDDIYGNRKAVEYELTLDYSTMQIIADDKGRRVKISSGDEGIGQILINRLNEEVEIERTDTIDGVSLPNLNFKTVALEGKKILLNSQLKIKDKNEALLTMEKSQGDRYSRGYAVPLEIDFVSSEEVFTPIPYLLDLGDSDGAGPGQNNGEIASLFYVNSREQDITLNLSLNMSFLFDVTKIEQNYSNPISRIDYKVYSDVQNLVDFKFYQTLYNLQYPTASGQSISFQDLRAITLKKNEGISLMFYTESNLGGFFDTGIYNVKFSNIVSTLKITENSYYPATNAKFILPFELLQRLLQIITNQKDDILRSSFLGRVDNGYSSDGYGSLWGITTGMLIRGFENTDFVGENIKDKRFKTSTKDFFDTFSALGGTGWGIEKVGFKEYVRFEDVKYFYQNVITIKLPNKVSDVSREVAKDYFYSSCEVGNKNLQIPEEVMGLDEPNTKSTFLTIITRLQNVLSLIHPYSTSIYNKEFARRKPKELFPLEDTKYDLTKFILDLKRGFSNVFLQRKWQDDFSIEPTGIYDVASATELRFTPANTLNRNGWLLRVGLEKYLGKKTRYASTDGNSNLQTKLIGGFTIKENGDFINSNFTIPRFLPEIIKFKHEVTYKEIKQIDGKTKKSNGEYIENFYGLVEFNNEKNEKEYGYLLSVKPNKEGEWEVLKANK